MKTPEQLAEEYLDKNYELNPHFPADVQGDKLPDRQAARPAFLAGYKAAQQWISVKDRLPEDDREVLVVLNGESYKDVHVSWHDGEDFGWATTGYVSHWMPLPAPPKEDK